MRIPVIISALAAILFAQHGNAQDSAQKGQLSGLLNSYYQVKDALVSGDGKQASLGATEFIKIANSLDYKLISEGNINALLKNASPISATEDLKTQRLHFASLSENMITLTKAMNFSSQPVYLVYCPMKKANWLSSEKAVKNPYYGKAMLNCGNVVETINH